MLHWQCLNTSSYISISHTCFPGDWPFPRCEKPVRVRPGIISSCLFLFGANCVFSHLHFSADHLPLSFGLSMRLFRHLPGSEDLSFSKELELLEFNTWIQVFPLGPASWKFHSEWLTLGSLDFLCNTHAKQIYAILLVFPDGPDPFSPHTPSHGEVSSLQDLALN